MVCYLFIGALLVFLLFVQGGQSLLFNLGKTELQQKMMLNSTGRKWEFTFTTLVTFGGAFFASFPLFYSTSFGGAYWVWTIILICFVIQAVSYEFQSKKGNLLGKRTYQIFLMINGIGGPLLLGTAVATFFTGSEFTVNKDQLMNVGMPVISSWSNPLHGLEAAFNIWNLCLGLAVFFLSRVQAILYFINNINDEELTTRCRKQLLPNAALFLVFFLAFLVHIMLREGYVGRNIADGNLSQKLQDGYQRVKNGELLTFRYRDNESTATSLAFIGASGSGKTTTINRILGNYPQSIYHSKYNFTQIVYLKIDCPHDGSLKSLCMHFFREIDRVLNTNYERKYGQKRHSRLRKKRKRIKKEDLKRKMRLSARQISRSEEELARKERVLKTLEKSEKAKENIDNIVSEVLTSRLILFVISVFLFIISIYLKLYILELF